MKPDMTVVQGDRLPAMQVLLQDSDGRALDVSGADAINFRTQLADKSRQATVTAADVLNARSGLVQHAWVAVETQLAGFLLVNVVVTTGGLDQTYPFDRYLVVQILPKLAPP